MNSSFTADEVFGRKRKEGAGREIDEESRRVFAPRATAATLCAAAATDTQRASERERESDRERERERERESSSPSSRAMHIMARERGRKEGGRGGGRERK
jgi:hypothetical protein